MRSQQLSRSHNFHNQQHEIVSDNSDVDQYGEANDNSTVKFTSKQQVNENSTTRYHQSNHSRLNKTPVSESLYHDTIDVNGNQPRNRRRRVTENNVATASERDQSIESSVTERNSSMSKENAKLRYANQEGNNINVSAREPSCSFKPTSVSSSTAYHADHLDEPVATTQKQYVKRTRLDQNNQAADTNSLEKYNNRNELVKELNTEATELSQQKTQSIANLSSSSGTNQTTSQPRRYQTKPVFRVSRNGEKLMPEKNFHSMTNLANSPASNSLVPSVTQSAQPDNSECQVTSTSSNAQLASLDLTFLSEEEKSRIFSVVKKDLEVRVGERQRLERMHTHLRQVDRQVAPKNGQTAVDSPNCLLCGRAFAWLINMRRNCDSCQRAVCRQCSQYSLTRNEYICSVCVHETGYQAMNCSWFYNTTLKRFNDFGTTAVAKSLVGQNIQNDLSNVQEDQLLNILDRHAEPPKEATFNEKTFTTDEIDRVFDSQIIKFRNRLLSLTKDTRKEVYVIHKDHKLTLDDKFQHFNSLCLTYKKSAKKLLKSFAQVLFITKERQNISQGLQPRHLSQKVIDVVKQEVESIVGHGIKDTIDDAATIISDDDMESVVCTDKMCTEEIFAHALLDKLLMEIRDLTGDISTYKRQHN